MMLSASYLKAGHADEYFGDAEWLPAKGRRRTGRRVAFLDAAFMLPSLIAEIAPLVLFWNAHLPVWQMSAMMGAAWATTWWLSCIIAGPLSKRPD
jgi:hypothetical protein